MLIAAIKNEVLFQASKKMMLPILYTVLTTICAFIISVQWNKPIIDFYWDDSRFNRFIIHNFLIIPTLIIYYHRMMKLI